MSSHEVVVATENDTVYALNERTGHVRWSTHLGRPAAASDLPCGNISPALGITSTPVIDAARHEVFVVADIMSGGQASHQLVGLNLSDGSVMLREGVDPAGIDTLATLQRVALNLDGSDVVFGYGGNFGDCSSYHGWVISVPEAGGPISTYELDPAPGDDQGAVWMGGAAPEIDSEGNIWVAVGNGSVHSSTDPYDGSDSVVELSASLKVIQYFAPADWAADNAGDRDLGSSAPALLSNGLIVQAGKSQTAYLLSQAKLGGVGGQLLKVSSFCGSDVDGGDAVQGSTVYMPCVTGMMAVQVRASPPSLHVKWQTTLTGGPPIIAGGLIWSIARGGVLYGFSPSGKMVANFAITPPANDFPTPSAAGQMLFAPGARRVYAFGR